MLADLRILLSVQYEHKSLWQYHAVLYLVMKDLKEQEQAMLVNHVAIGRQSAMEKGHHVDGV